MRTLLTVLVCLVVLSGSAVVVAERSDSSAADAAALRARAAEAVAKQREADCGCTAATRAKDRVASRNTADDDASK